VVLASLVAQYEIAALDAAPRSIVSGAGPSIDLGKSGPTPKDGPFEWHRAFRSHWMNGTKHGCSMDGEQMQKATARKIRNIWDVA